MKLSLRGEYALRALVVLGLNYGEEVLPIQVISERQNIPKRFLEQILNELSRVSEAFLVATDCVCRRTKSPWRPSSGIWKGLWHRSAA